MKLNVLPLIARTKHAATFHLDGTIRNGKLVWIYLDDYLSLLPSIDSGVGRC